MSRNVDMFVANVHISDGNNFWNALGRFCVLRTNSVGMSTCFLKMLCSSIGFCRFRFVLSFLMSGIYCGGLMACAADPGFPAEATRGHFGRIQVSGHLQVSTKFQGLSNELVGVEFDEFLFNRSAHSAGPGNGQWGLSSGQWAVECGHLSIGN